MSRLITSPTLTQILQRLYKIIYIIKKTIYIQLLEKIQTNTWITGPTHPCMIRTDTVRVVGFNFQYL